MSRTAKWTRTDCGLLIALFALLCTASRTAERHVFPLTLTNQSSDFSDCDFPATLHVEILSYPPFPKVLSLYRKDVMNTNAPTYVIHAADDGAIYLAEIESGPKETAAYQNEDSGAAFIVKCTSDLIEIRGTLHVEGRKYRVNPVKGQVVTRATRHDYEFVFVNDTFHWDDRMQRQLERARDSLKRGDSTGPRALVQESRTARAKRDTTTADYYIDVLVALDYAFFQYWMDRSNQDSATAVQQAKEYVAYIFNGINARYDTITTSPFRLHIVLAGFLVAQTPEASPWTETVKEEADGRFPQVNADLVLSSLKNYTRDNYGSLPQHDHLMLITEYDLYGSDNGFRFNNTAGLAYVGTMCMTDGESVSVVEDHGGYQSESTATHELGHSLGAQHDGTDNTCNSDDRYVMAGGVHAETEANKLNPWRFSGCSVSYFEALVQQLLDEGYDVTCLSARVTNTDVPQTNGSLPGELSGPDEQCRQIYGSSSYLCRGTVFGTAEDVCLSMFCRNPSIDQSCTLATAAAGTCCGNQRWCINGQCVESPSAKCYMSSTCPFGQRQGVVYENLTCNELESGNCYNENFRQICCEMCDNSHTNIAGCEYGDKVRQCNTTYCGQALPSGELYDVNCCGTCSHVPTTLTSIDVTTTTTPIRVVPEEVDICRDTALVEGTEPCSTYLSRQGNLAYCCQAQVQDFCCRTCEDFRSSDPFCPFGDCADCTALQTRPVPCTDDQRQDCCQTCNELDLRFSTTAAPTTTTSTTTAPTTTTVQQEQEEECEPVLGVITCTSSGRVAVDMLLLGISVCLTAARQAAV